MNSAYIAICCWSFLSLLISLSKGEKALAPRDFVHSFYSTMPEIEHYVKLQHKLEQIADENNLANLPKREKMYRIKKLLEDPKLKNYIDECNKFHVIKQCNDSLYRLFDGTCNNLNHPEWGSAVTKQERVLPAAYDGHFKVRKSVTGDNLPAPRSISLALSGESVESEITSALYVYFGQFVAHDITLSPVATRTGSVPNCCETSAKEYDECQLPIEIEDKDPFYNKFNATCPINFVRSASYPSCTFEKRTPLNKKTSFVDLSQVYSNSHAEKVLLRIKDGSGKLKVQQSSSGHFLPKSNKELPYCLFRKPETCLAGGDERLNQHVMLTSIQTLFTRWHNKIAGQLREMNLHWYDKKIFHETRRLAIALYQKIIYEEYMILLISQDLIHKYSLTLNFDGGSFYDNFVNPTEFVEFSTAAMRLHSMIPARPSKFHPNLRTNQTFSYDQPLFEGKLSSLVTGASEVSSGKYDEHWVEDVVNYLNSPPGSSHGFDIAVYNIQRGRDHGLPPYVDLVHHCLKIKIKRFSDLHQLMTDDKVKLLKKIYKDVRDIDAWVGFIMETHDEGIELGPTSSTILAMQFHNLKYGDAFFFTHTNGRYPFTTDQLASIRNFTLARFLCDTMQVPVIRRHPFRVPSDENPLVPCYEIPTIDWMLWKDKFIAI